LESEWCHPVSLGPRVLYFRPFSVSGALTAFGKAPWVLSKTSLTRNLPKEWGLLAFPNSCLESSGNIWVFKDASILALTS
jgi:hypothetical protein